MADATSARGKIVINGAASRSAESPDLCAVLCDLCTDPDLVSLFLFDPFTKCVYTRVHTRIFGRSLHGSAPGQRLRRDGTTARKGQKRKRSTMVKRLKATEKVH